MRILNFIFFFVIAGVVFAQNEGQSIELPDFVITGVRNVDIPTMAKKRPELIPVVNKTFFNPVYSPEQLDLATFSNPIARENKLFSDSSYYSGLLKVGVGRYSLPVGSLNLSISQPFYLMDASVWGSNIGEYVDNAGYNVSGAKLSNNFFVSSESGFLPGSRISLTGYYYRDSYKFYGASFDQGQKRETENGQISFGIRNTLNSLFKMGGELSANIMNIKDANIKDNNYVAKAFAEFGIRKISLFVNAQFHRQEYKNDLPGQQNYNFFDGSAYVKVSPASNLNGKFGLYTFLADGSSYFSPSLMMDVGINDRLSLSASLMPYVKPVTVTDMQHNNRYMDFRLRGSFNTKDKINFNTSLVYQYNKYFEIDASFGYSLFDSYVYYEDYFFGGRFYPFTIDDVKKLSGNIRLLFHPGPSGMFYSNITFQSVKNADGMFVPYQPQFLGSLVYAYDFDSGIGFKVNYTLKMKTYTDLTNLNELSNYHDLSVSGYYELMKNLNFTVSFENLFNRDNYLLKNYLEKPFDVVVGAEYRW